MWNTFFQCDVHMFYGGCENGGQKVSLQSPKLSFISKPIFELTLRDSLRRSHATIFFRATPAPPLLSAALGVFVWVCYVRACYAI